MTKCNGIRWISFGIGSLFNELSTFKKKLCLASDSTPWDFQRLARPNRIDWSKPFNTPLMLAQEVKDLGERREIVFYENLRPIRSNKIRYFEDPILKTRIKPPPEVPMIIDPTRPPPRRIPPPEPEQAGRIVEQVPRPARPGAAPIRPRQKPRPGSLLARNPPIDPVVIEAGVSAYLQDFTSNDTSVGNPHASS